jgi:hypothetical protein
MAALEKIRAVTGYKSGRDTSYIDQVSLAMVFHEDPDVVKCVFVLPTLGTIKIFFDCTGDLNISLLP